MDDHPKVFISYSHDSREHADRVLTLCNRLRTEGFDTVIDQFVGGAFPPEGWPRWQDRMFRQADFVLAVCTETYLRRLELEEAAAVGRGVKSEGLQIYNYIFRNDSLNTKVIPVVFTHADLQFVPSILSGGYCELDTEDGYRGLHRHLRRLPGAAMAPLGQLAALAALPEIERQHDVFATFPYDRNIFFTGRDTLLQDLHTALEQRQRVVVSGLGGIGKTQVALEYGYRHVDEYERILWISAESESILSAGFVELARLLNLPQRDAQDQSEAVAAAKNWLESNSRWLLIVDNADEPNVVKLFLPRGSNGRVLLTSRAQRFDALGITRPVEIRALPPEEAFQFLLKRTGREDEADPSERFAAQTLALELGHLPLALEQAAAYIMAMQSRFAAYLTGYRARRLKLLARGTPADDPTKSVTTTWQIAFDRLEETPASADLLRASAFLSPDRIPLELIADGAEQLGPAIAQALPDAQDALALDELLEPLTRYSLIRREPATQSYSLHRLVQEVVREGLDPAARQAWAQRVLAALASTFPDPNDHINWPYCERITPHTFLTAHFIEQHDLASESVALLLIKTAFYLNERARYADAELLLQRALFIWEDILGSQHPDVATTLNNLAGLYYAQGRYADAEPLYRRAVAIDEHVYGCDHPEVATDLNNLAELYRAQGRYADAEPFYHRALTMRERNLGMEHLKVAMSLNNLAGLNYTQRRYEEAMPLYLRALPIFERELGTEHPYVATILNNLGELYRAYGRYTEAEPLHQRALAIREHLLGPQHPDVAMSLNNLAELYRAQRRYTEAEPLQQRALAIREHVLGPEHPDVAESLNNLAELYRAQGRYADARPLYQRALEIAERALGPEHPDTVTVRHNLTALAKI